MPDGDIEEEKNPRPLDEDDIALLKTYVQFFHPCSSVELLAPQSII